jgi:5-hydroxyisourate hydrolase/2-oxo-4-hydroxy-4-carboxy-5-ureidoimidazoline decarboxylase
MGRLSTHILDVSRGVPAAGVAIELLRLESTGSRTLASFVTNSDGRTDGPLLSDADLAAGIYELVFHIGAYFGGTSADAGFFDTVPIRFRVSDAAGHYHVPLLVTPWSYSTYRGS